MTKENDLLRTLKSRNHQHIFTWQDKYLCSRTDPQKEAQAWLSQRQSQINSAKYLIVLGLGCGFYIIELLKNFPHKRIIVIETQKSIADFFEKQYPLEASQVQILIISQETELLTHKEIQKALQNFYIVLSCEQYFNIFPILKTYRDWLIGRHYESLHWLLNIRGLREEFKMTQLGLKDWNRQALSLFDVQKSLSLAHSVNAQELNQKMEALKELIL